MPTVFPTVCANALTFFPSVHNKMVLNPTIFWPTISQIAACIDCANSHIPSTKKTQQQNWNSSNTNPGSFFFLPFLQLAEEPVGQEVAEQSVGGTSIFWVKRVLDGCQKNLLDVSVLNTLSNSIIINTLTLSYCITLLLPHLCRQNFSFPLVTW